MKIPRNEFKAVIKECLKELISEGALNNAIASLIQTQGIPLNGMQVGMQGSMPADPRIQAVAQSMARNGADAKLYEAIFTDAMGTMAHQNGADPQAMMQNNMGGMNNMMPQQQYNMQQMPQQQYYQGFQQPQQFVQPQQPYMQMQQPMMQQPGQPMMLQQGPNNPNGQGGNINRWAQLAFNSPIKNRPDADGGLSGIGGGGTPGASMGKFD